MVFNFTAPRYTLLFLNFEIYIVHVINCEWSRSINFSLRMFCMQYKLCFSNKKLQKNWEWVKCLQFRSKLTLEIQKFNIRTTKTNYKQPKIILTHIKRKRTKINKQIKDNKYKNSIKKLVCCRKQQKIKLILLKIYVVVQVGIVPIESI